MNIDSSNWGDYCLLVSGICRNQHFMAHLNRCDFRQFWEALAEHFDVPCDGDFLKVTIISVLMVNNSDGDWLRDHNLVTFSV